MSKKMKLLAKANLVMSKAHIKKDLNAPDGSVEKVTFDIVEKGADVIKTPRIDLDGSFFSDFLTSGRVEQYEVELEITARRTKFDHKGIPAVVEAELKADEEIYVDIE